MNSGDGEVTDEDEMVAALDPIVDANTDFTQRVLALWEKHRKKYAHDYALVGRLLSPNPDIMAKVKENTTIDDEDACERLIFKLLLPETLFGQELVAAKVGAVKKFKAELKHFQNRTGIYDKDYIWELAKVMPRLVFFFV